MINNLILIKFKIIIHQNNNKLLETAFLLKKLPQVVYLVETIKKLIIKIKILFGIHSNPKILLITYDLLANYKFG